MHFALSFRRLKLKICPLLILGPHSKVNDRLILTILRFQYSSWSKGDILVRTAEGCGQSCGDTPLANPDLLWPSGIVEFRFYKTFPKYFPMLSHVFGKQLFTQKAHDWDEEGNALHHQPHLMCHLCACHQTYSQLCDYSARSFYLKLS